MNAQAELPSEEALFTDALRLQANERAAYLDRATCGDALLRQRVERLLASYEAGDFLERAGEPGLRQAVADSVFPVEKPGDRIGRYKLLQQIGEGGCGVVYMAEQDEPVRRRVALKIVKLGMDTRSVIARFEAERQALAIMEHPNIARVFDAGATETGRPYFVMELVRGMKITEYCDRARLSNRQRLDLFISVCQAVQHAHQKGIIHRDLKPSNILVTETDGAPVPKIIDFGIAKAITDQRLTDKTLFTAFDQFIGTPAYTSPEQAGFGGLDIDTRSDIYSLGVLLYELLTGQPPFSATEFRRAAMDEILRVIREKEPARPSTRVTTLSQQDLLTVAQQRRVEWSSLPDMLRGDLDWIVMKALEKDRSRRYETAAALALDIQRHLGSEPILARPPSAIYRMQKFAGRNRTIVTSTLFVAAALVLGSVVSAWQAVRATRAEQEQARLRRKAEADEQNARLAGKREAEQRLVAEAARRSETLLRGQAEARAYASDMNLVQQAIAMRNLGRAEDLLLRHWPARESPSAANDLRHWEWRYLWDQTRSSALFTLCKQPSEIHSLALSPDGNTVAIGTYHGGGLSLWDWRTRKERLRLGESEQWLRAAFSPVEPILAFTGDTVLPSGRMKRQLHFWNLATRKMLIDLPLDARCMGLAFSQDGHRLATSTAAGNLTIWRVPEGSKLATYPAGQSIIDPATALVVTPDLRLAAYGWGAGRSGWIRALDLQSGAELWTVKASEEHILALALSPDGKVLASGSGFGESVIRLWDMATGKELGQLEGHTAFVTSLVFWPDGNRLASSSADQTVRIWNVRSRECDDVLLGHRLEVWRLALLPDASTLVSGAKDGSVCFWNTATRHRKQNRITLPEKVSCWRFSADGRSVITLNHEGAVTRWTGSDFQDNQRLLHAGANIIPWPKYNVFSADARFLATGSGDGIVRVWDVERGVLWKQLTNAPGMMAAKEFHAGGSRLIAWSEERNVLQDWDLTNQTLTHSWSAPPLYDDAVTLSPAGRLVIAVGSNGDTATADVMGGDSAKVNLHLTQPSGVTFSPSGDLFAVSSYSGYVRIWRTTDWREMGTLRGYLVGVDSVGFSPDGKRLVTGSDNKEALRLWDVENQQDVLTLEGPGSSFFRTAFSPDGNSIGTCNQVGTLHIWRAPSWAQIEAAERADLDQTSPVAQ